MTLRILVALLWVLGGASLSYGQPTGARQVHGLNDAWRFYFADQVRRDLTKADVTLPHTWNADQVYRYLGYDRTAGNYERTLRVPEAWRGKRLFLRFEGVNTTAQVLVNQRWAGAHEGGYTAFCIEITDLVRLGEDNLITVQASNAYRLDVLPLAGDFNVYGGIHRPVSLIVTNPDCITPLDYASAGVYLTPDGVSATTAEVAVVTKLSRRSDRTLELVATLLDAADRTVDQVRTLATAGDAEVRQRFLVRNPHLWHARTGPYLYRVRVQLVDGEAVVDEVTEPLGLRSFRVDPERGFFLNDQYLDLHGFCRHEDVAGRGSALTPADHEADVALAVEAGATTLRLTHYPQSEGFYDLCDRAGLVLWTEIPLVGPGGYPGPGYVRSPALEAHARQVLTELVRQQYNHPSVFFWGLFNELKLDYDRPDDYVRALDSLVHREDPTRLTTLATFQADSVFTDLSDVVAWNKYFGWYGGNPAQMGTWADEIHRALPGRPVAVSEYGAGGSIRQHDDTLRRADPNSRWHPEGWQAYYHEENWRALRQRPFLWGKYIWLLTDFGSAIRREGDTLGVNDKGLVTYDRRVRKDAFYFYKANWNPEPMVYLADRRHTLRQATTTRVKVYTNLTDVELLVNGESVGRRRPDELHMVCWEGVTLRTGDNEIKVNGRLAGKTFTDGATWRVVAGSR